MSPAAPSADSPWPVREVNAKVKAWIERLGQIWVEGQLTQINAKPTWKLSYLTLRDTEADASVQLTCYTSLLRNSPVPLRDGERVIVHGKPAFYPGRGSFSLWVTEIRPVGIGELLARIEMLRRTLAAEGLFDPSRKKRLPYLPNCVGLITGRGSAAERDVLSVAKDRWPEVRFRVINTPVQGATAAPEIIRALGTLDADPEVDVIIIARGGGSVEDLLPFSEESLQRAVAAASTPVVSAIGHEPDAPVLDNVADLRTATPTDAAKRVVPDVAEQRALIQSLRARSAQALRGWVQHQSQALQDLRSRPVLADPMLPITRRSEELTQFVRHLRVQVTHDLDQQETRIQALRSRVATLGPSATLARGYAVVQVGPAGAKPEVVTSIDQTPPGSQLRIRVTDGAITAATMATRYAD
ncbi:exodeoxyribonuclease VII large subunit [Corynebacterium sp. CCM 9185]|uniref:Exodeoxyribonuclease 7 large subunit n=1 Tax=Corynebacterium marambiense TaxID=2765364 RepID=A0ABS0VTI5_9CORY|nr:exodeoxyribonuclease VII large subunit [Corynebacterium marambiense]MCK7663434.1 exodeoxyribonuclease VII large subunit [Corynebacterium marambiense]